MTLPLDNLGGIRDPAIRRNFEILAQQFPVAATGGGGGGAPSGPAGGVLGGTYPNPGFAADMATQAELDTHAADTTAVHGIADTSLLVVTSDARLTDARVPTAHKASHEPGGTDALTGLTNASIAAGAGIAKTKLASLDVVNADVNAAAAIAESKLNLATDAAAGTGSRRTLGTGATQAAAGNDSRFPAGADIVDADVSATAAIAESKLNLATDAAAGTGSRRTLGTSATSAAAGNRGQPTGGTSGQVLTKNSATNYDSGWSTPATAGTPAATGAFSAHRSTAVSYTTGSVVVFNTELFDVSGWFDNATGIFTPLTAGYYRLSAGVYANAAVTADVFWQCRLQKNGTDFHAGSMTWQRAAAQTPLSVGSWLVQANGSTDNFKITIIHNQGTAVAITTNTVGTYFQGELVGT